MMKIALITRVFTEPITRLERVKSTVGRGYVTASSRSATSLPGSLLYQNIAHSQSTLQKQKGCVIPRAGTGSADLSNNKATESDRNRRLSQRIKELVGRKPHYYFLKQHTRLYRSGKISSTALITSFLTVLDEFTTAEILIELAALIPMRKGELQEAAGCLFEVCEGKRQGSASTFGWTPLNRDKISARAAQIVGSLESRDTESGCTENTHSNAMVLQESGGPHIDSEFTEARKGRKRSAPDRDAAAVASRGHAVLIWLRQDLRLHDNPTLAAGISLAQRYKGHLSFLFVHSPEEDGDDLSANVPETAVGPGSSWRPGGASLVWLEAALGSLDASLRQYGKGAGIIFRRGPYLQALREVAGALHAGTILFGRRYEPAMEIADASITAQLRKEGYMVQSFNSLLLHEPASVQIDMEGRWSGHFGTLMPFVRACEKLGLTKRPLPAPREIPVAAEDVAKQAGGLLLEHLKMVPLPVRRDGVQVDWGRPIREAWDISEAGALSLLEDFLQSGLHKYEAQRQYADARAVSRLSPYIHFGQLSVRLLQHRLQAAGASAVSKTFWRRLFWRELAYWQLHHWPAMASTPIRPHYASQVWRDDLSALRAWQRGETGFPLVDAGMRQLWQTGWMQQSIRMVCAAFLTEYMNLHWVHGARWFHDTLVDADLAINSMMWQNAGKSGLDQWNFTLSAVSTAQDPSGEYIAQWVPELAKLPRKWIHQPWNAPLEVLESCGVSLGFTYPSRIMIEELQTLRELNVQNIRMARQLAGKTFVDDAGYDVIPVPEGSTKGQMQHIRVFTKEEYRAQRGALGHSKAAHVKQGVKFRKPRSRVVGRRN